MGGGGEKGYLAVDAGCDLRLFPEFVLMCFFPVNLYLLLAICNRARSLGVVYSASMILSY